MNLCGFNNNKYSGVSNGGEGIVRFYRHSSILALFLHYNLPWVPQWQKYEDNYKISYSSWWDGIPWYRSYIFKKLVENLVLERGILSYHIYRVVMSSSCGLGCHCKTHLYRVVIHRNISAIRRAQSRPCAQGPANIDWWCFLFIDRLSCV